jgi:hypothetical protein
VKTCRWYVSIQQPECGEVASHTVKVKTKVTQATVDLCDSHYAIHNENFAKIRTARAHQP